LQNLAEVKIEGFSYCCAQRP